MALIINTNCLFFVLLELILFLVCQSTPRKTYRIYNHGLTTVVVSYDQQEKMLQCLMKMEKEEDTPQPVLGLTGIHVTSLSFNQMLKIIIQCHELKKSTENHFHEHNAWSPYTLFRGIMPGTLWCGMGDIAPSYDDLGTDEELDRCCRTHDHCPVRILPAKYHFGILNFSVYTKSHCLCDDHLYNCFKKVNTTESEVIGSFYFNVMKVQCITENVQKMCKGERNGPCNYSATPHYKFINAKRRW